MRSRLVSWQLRMFLVVTVAAITVMSIYYVRLPQLLGVGRYPIQVELTDSGGLYPKSLVSYRGLEVGTVERLDLRPRGGVIAHLQIDNDVELPADATAQVRSSSVIGEQYLNFLPPEDGSSRSLKAGATVPADRTTLPTTTNDLLNSMDALLASVPQKDLRTTVDELGVAFDGSDRELERLLDDGGAFLETAHDNLDPTTRLIDDSETVLATQQDLDPAIRSYATSLDSLTAQLEASDVDLEAVIRNGGPTVREAGGLSQDLSGTLPGLLDETADTAEVAGVYRDGIEHVFTVLPAATVMFAAGVPPADREKDYVRTNMFFKMSFPTPCTTGFPEKDRMRDPADLTLADLPVNSYCKVDPDSDLVVRGARNNPCPNNPDRRGRTAADCGLIFDEEAAERSEVVRGPSGTGMADSDAAELIAPNGPLFLLDDSGATDPGDWADLMRGLVKR